jgi:Skp family chaperone for outer membrane proteins
VAVLIVVLVPLLSACSSAYYGAMEKLGYEKRDLLIKRVDNARNAQQDAKKQFESALAQFIAVTDFSGGRLEQQYNKLKDEYDESEQRAHAVRTRVADVERVAEDLFDEWSRELTQYASQEMRRSSQRQLEQTRARYQKLIAVMKRAEKKLNPVLAAYRDRVLYLKHNLNARAIASLRSERAKVEADIGALISDMSRSISEADAFIKEMASSKN